MKLIFFLLATFYWIVPVYGFECTSGTYSDDTFETPLEQFTPYDKIYVKIDCRQLGAGEYTMLADWVHAKQGIIRTDEYSFTIRKKSDHTIYFWFKLSRRGPLKSAFTNKDFYEENFGWWSVEVFLNDKLIGENKFSIF